VIAGGLTAAQIALPPASPADPVVAIVDAFRSHDIVTLTDPHGNAQVQALLLSLVRDSRFGAAADDLVIETLSARYQDVIDRYVRGEPVAFADLRLAWENHTVPNNLGTGVTELLRTIRAVNVSRASDKQLRVVAGDPPIDWTHITARADHSRWIGLRDSSPADLVRRQVLDRGRRALVLYGQLHLQRRQIVTNYDMSTWQAQTLVSLLERDHRARVFNIWTLLDRNIDVPDEVRSWRVPSLAIVRGTALGARDFASYSRAAGGARIRLKDGQTVPVPQPEWEAMPMQEQFDAVLYLGPPESLTTIPMDPSMCADAGFVAGRVDRLMRFAPPIEVENFKKACGA
jgi:hypothetical protein